MPSEFQIGLPQSRPSATPRAPKLSPAISKLLYPVGPPNWSKPVTPTMQVGVDIRISSMKPRANHEMPMSRHTLAKMGMSVHQASDVAAPLYEALTIEPSG